MSEKVVILVTVGNEAEGMAIARHLLEAKLAACVNLSSPIKSIYWWEGKIAEDGEYQLFIKSTRALFPQIAEAVAKLHSYTTPELICLPIVDGSPAYLGWIEDSVMGAG